MTKTRLSFWQIWNMSFGFFGIQFGFGLQMGNMSAIYEYLGARPHELPLLWLAAPLSGLIVQPLVGHFSDRTWGVLGRRRPYFLVGAILSSLALVVMPNSSTLWMAAGLLWILDSSVNISMEPFRAFVADLLPEDQRTRGFAMQSLFIGLGDALGFWMARTMRFLGVGQGGAPSEHVIPTTVRISFYVGAVVFLGAVLWTVFSTKEHPPADMEAFRREKEKAGGFLSSLREIPQAIMQMPQTMRQLAWVQVFTWLGLFCMWLFFVPAVARYVYGATDPSTKLYQDGVEFGSWVMGWYAVVCFAFSPLLPILAKKLGRKLTHSICLAAGAIGLLFVPMAAKLHTPELLYVSMVGVGMAWASILSMPYAMLAGSLPPEKTGTYMGVFNFFIVIPEICTALFFGWVMKNVLHDNHLTAVVVGGAFMLVAAALVFRVKEAVTPAATVTGQMSQPQTA